MPKLHIPPDASPEEAAALAAAIDAHLAVTGSDEGADDGETGNGRRWRLQSRIETVTGCSGRVPRQAPVDMWRAANRMELY